MKTNREIATELAAHLEKEAKTFLSALNFPYDPVINITSKSVDTGSTQEVGGGVYFILRWGYFNAIAEMGVHASSPVGSSGSGS